MALDAAPGAIVAMKDPTRGGVASALHEMAEKSRVGIVVDEMALPVTAPVRAASELLGIDPLHVANEGKAVLGVRAGAADAILRALRAHPLGRDAALVGRCTEERAGAVILDTGFGRRLVTELEGEPLPRIC
jgi:hydrogenase expression/formation protein HypE